MVGRLGTIVVLVQ